MCSFQRVMIDLVKAMSRNTAVSYAVWAIISAGFGFLLSTTIAKSVEHKLVMEALTPFGEKAADLKFIQSRDLQSQINAIDAHAKVVDEDLKMRDSQFIAMREQFNTLSKTMDEVKADAKKLLERGR